jgi:hypothetical protein
MQTYQLSECRRRNQSLILNVDRPIRGAIAISSHHTGKVVSFKAIGEDHPMFDQDHWDGEMAIYQPEEQCNVDVLIVIFHKD